MEGMARLRLSVPIEVRIRLAALRILFQLLLARLPLLDRWIGMDRLTVWHRWVGFGVSSGTRWGTDCTCRCGATPTTDITDRDVYVCGTAPP
jgi:hypothetical protein